MRRLFRRRDTVPAAADTLSARITLLVIKPSVRAGSSVSVLRTTRTVAAASATTGSAQAR